jgi:methionine sulfoxide reductase heme-binding subunit
MITASATAGVISMVLLTAVVLLGILVNRRVGQPPAAGVSLHRITALVALAFLALHIVAAIEAPYARIGVAAVFVPFAEPGSPLWIGLGAIGTDLMLVLIGTSLLRRRVGRRTWRALHWLAYACWPAAMAHSLGIGAGLRAGKLLDLALACIAAVLAAVAWRIGAARRSVYPAPAAPAAARVQPALRPAASGQDRPSAYALRVDPIACTGHGVCAELLPELITLDHWGYPMLADVPVPARLLRRARRTVTDCPVLALRLSSAGPAELVGRPGGETGDLLR